MKKQLRSFFAGVLTTLLLVGCVGTAFAAGGGKVLYNFCNVALNGQQKITAGQYITAPNGQKVPGTLLYVDEAGGKTNYLPIRAVSDLLNTQIGYNGATRTVLLGQQPSAANNVLYDAHGVKIIYKGLEMNGIFGPEVKLYIENNNSRGVLIQTRDASVNGFMVNPIMSEEIAPGKKVMADMTLMKNELKDSGITKLHTMEVKFMIADQETWDTIELSQPVTISFS